MSVLTSPFWQPDTPQREPPDRPPPPVVDVLIVGGGYTGLSAARETAAAGARTLVLEAGSLGAGCSGRNGGQVAFSIKPSLAALTARHGRERALAICHEGREAVAYLRMLATEGGLDCDWRPNGGYFGAHTPRQFEAMAREAEKQIPGLEQRITVVPRAEQHREIASDAYHGGCVYHDDASVDPMRLLTALLQRATDAGASVLQRCPALAVQPSGGGFEVSTPHGTIRTRKLLIATNGYSGPLSPWLRRRVIPIGSYQIATERLGTGRVRDLIPQARNICDSQRVIVYFRPSPDGERIVYGGRAALAEKDPLVCVPRLRNMLTAIFPQLEGVAITHAWVGWVAYTFDTLPHLGTHAGIHYCMGYCGQGVPLAPHFGRRIGQQMMGLSEGRTALDGLPFPTRFFYRGDPWFMAPSVLVYRALDALGW
jgi:glycine/D-amino acid oxidase-like deaminating enzyme